MSVSQATVKKKLELARAIHPLILNATNHLFVPNNVFSFFSAL